MTSVLCLRCLNVSRTIQRFTDIILDLNFKSVSTYTPNFRSYNSHRSFKMNKREKKRLKNKRQRQNKKGKYFQSNYDHDDYMPTEQQIVVTKVVDPEKDKPMLDYLLPEDVLLVEKSEINKKCYFPIEKGSYNPEDEQVSEDKDSSDREEDKEIGKEWNVIESTTEDQTSLDLTEFSLIEKSEFTEETKISEDQHEETKDLISPAEIEKSDCELVDIKDTAENSTENNQDEENKETSEDEELESQQNKEEEVECKEGEEFTKSILDFENNMYYEPIEENENVQNLAKAESLDDCLRFFVKSEHLTDEYYCEKCNSGDKEVLSKAVKRALFLKTPRNLVLNIKRFTHSTYHVKKDTSRVKFPLRFCLDPFMVKTININDVEEIIRCDEMRTNDAKPEDIYELYGVVSHSGGMGGGHYVCYISYMEHDNQDKEGSNLQSQHTKEWYYISDSHFQSVSESKVLNSEAYTR